ncbi:murein transglycosylase [Symbioplanes lichenis]|uniref:murein transglycosylase n=1 Tax=Symbioplanes lichenis TaxID=1629072 RepID=UPI00273A2234|nr:murein transglycosylase [Actinoplanes lichenis]
MVDGQNTPSQRPAAPHLGGPLGSSGAAPEQTPGPPSDQSAPSPQDAAAPQSEPAQDPNSTPSPIPHQRKAPDLEKETLPRQDQKTPPEARSTSPEAADTTPPPASKPDATKPEPNKPEADKPEATKPEPGKPEATKPEPPTTSKSATEPATAKGKKDKPDREPPAPSVTAMALASRSRPPTRKLRKAGPGAVARNTAEWAHRPSGRLILPAILAVVLIGAAGTAGAYLVPQALQSSPAPSATPAFGAGTAGAGTTGAGTAGAGSAVTSAQPGGTLPGAVPGGTQPGATPGISVPPGVLPSVSSAPTVGGVPSTAVALPGGVTQTRPADALATWAQQAGTRAGIPVVAVQAYGYAELVAARTTPGCHLSWTTLAAIGKVESSHGSFNGSILNTDGTVTPPIYGLPLDGQGGRQVIRDTDQGVLDKDTTYDRAIGPMQFIPQTWNALAVGNAVDADGNGVPDPNDIDDAALAAALYLCKGGRDMSRPDAWWEAILSYNAVRPYAQKVFEAANQYGTLSQG